MHLRKILSPGRLETGCCGGSDGGFVLEFLEFLDFFGNVWILLGKFGFFVFLEHF